MKLALQNEVAVSNDEVRQLDRAYVFHSWSMQGNLHPLVIAGRKAASYGITRGIPGSISAASW